MARYATVLTTIGENEIANYGHGGEKVNITTFAVGDGGGSYYMPTKDMTALKGEKWRGPVNDVTVSADKPNVIIITALIPPDVGGFNIREGAAFNADGKMIGIMNTALVEKSAGDGSDAQLYMRMRLAVSSTDAIAFPTDPNVIVATKADVIEYVTAYAAPLTHTHAATAITESTGESVEEAQRRQDNTLLALQAQLNTFSWTFAPAELGQWVGYNGSGLPGGILDPSTGKLYY